MYEQVRQVVSTWLAQHPGTDLRVDNALFLDVTNRRIDGSCYLFFGGSTDEPRLVVKAARTPAGRAVFETEYRNLQALDERGLNAGGPMAPVPLGCFDQGGTLIALQSALPGTPIKNVPGPDLFAPGRIEATFDRVLEFWERLQQAFGTPLVTLDEASYEREVLRPVRRFERSFLLDTAERELLAERFESRRELAGAELPWMVRHGDFCAANMVQGPRGIGVFDWESPLAHATPLFDLLFFFSSLRFPYSGPRGESTHFESFHSVWWEDSYFARAVRARLREISRRYGVPAPALPDLFLLSLVQVANMKFQGLVDSHGMEVDLDRPVDEAGKRDRWAAFSRPDKDAPFACIRDGAFENLRLAARRGLPVF